MREARASAAPYNRPVIVARAFDFQAAHHLPRHPGKCRNLHGHSYRLVVRCAGDVDPKSGMVLDFADVKAVVEERILSVVDHTLLNDLMENPTAENVAAWIWDELELHLPLDEIRLYETPYCYVVHRGR